MKTLIRLSRQDFRATFRDPIFKGLLFFPFIAFALVRWGLPFVAGRYPPVEPYAEVILMWACMQTATMFGFIYGFLFLEEKEENILPVLRVLPVSTAHLVASRLLLGFSISTAVNGALLHFGGVIRLPLWQAALLALQFSFLAPLIALALATLARNRIEGLAQMKIVNIALMAPALIYFLPYRILHLTALTPSYWSFRSLEAGVAGDGFWWFFAIGTIYYLFVLGLLNRRFVLQAVL